MTASSDADSRADAVGLVGTGHQTEYLSARLLGAGRRLVILNRDQQQSGVLVARGARDAANAFYLTSAVDTVLLTMPDVRALEVVMEGPEGVLSALAPGQLVINVGTSLPASDRRLAALVAARGGDMLDAPLVTHGDRWTAVVGGSREAYERAKPLLELFAHRVGHVGPSGFGQLTKLLDQMVQAARTAALAEGLSFARQVGLDAELTADLLELSGVAEMLHGDFEGHGELRQHTRDLGYALEVAQDAGLLAPLTAMTNEIYKAVAAHGESDWREAAVIRYWE
jgi:2-hydroxy-3-oxopropionate reductase